MVRVCCCVGVFRLMCLRVVYVEMYGVLFYVVSLLCACVFFLFHVFVGFVCKPVEWGCMVRLYIVHVCLRVAGV